MQEAQAASGARFQEIDSESEAISQKRGLVDTAHSAYTRLLKQKTDIDIAKEKLERREGFSSLGEFMQTKQDPSSVEAEMRAALIRYGTIAYQASPLEFREFAKKEFIAQAERSAQTPQK